MQTEKPHKVLCRDMGQLVHVDTMHTRQTTSDFDDVSRLVSLPAMRHGRQIRTVGFDQQTVQRDVARDVAQLIGLLESDDPRKGNHEPEIDRALRKLFAAAETMKDAATIRAVVIGLKYFDRFCLGFTRMNDHRQIQITCGMKLAFENSDLHVTR